MGGAGATAVNGWSERAEHCVLYKFAAMLVALHAVVACNPVSKGPVANDGSTSTATSAPLATVSPTHADAAPRGRLQFIEATQDSDALSLIRTRRLQAKADGRTLVVYVGATWCEPCKRFKAEIQSGRLDDRLGNLTLLAFDVDKDGDRLATAGYSYRFVPFVALPSAGGRPMETQQATGRGGDAWRELLVKLEAWQTPR